MLQHASLEVTRDRLADCVAFWQLLGFTPMEPPPKLRGRFTWVEREGTQIHLIPVDEPVPAREGHVAVVAADYDGALAALRDAGFAPTDGENAWDAPRSFVREPAGHLGGVRRRGPPPRGRGAPRRAGGWWSSRPRRTRPGRGSSGLPASCAGARWVA